MESLLFTALGIVILLAVAHDAHATILHSRGRNGPVAQLIFGLVWRLGRAVAHGLPPKERHKQQNSIGPLLMPLLIGVYLALFVMGYALIYYPRIESEFVINPEATASRWSNSLYFSSVTLTTLGYGDITPHTGAMRLVAFIEALSGLGLISLSISYLVAIYRALERKRTAALAFYLLAQGGAGVISFIVNHMVGGKLSGLSPTLRTSARDLQEMFESHVEHPIIHFFHPEEVYKGLPRVLYISIELCTVIRSCFDRVEYADILERAELNTLESSTLHILDHFARSLKLKPSERGPDPEQLRRHVSRVLNQLKDVGIKVEPDADLATREYQAGRAQWEPQLKSLAGYLGYDWDEIIREADIKD